MLLWIILGCLSAGVLAALVRPLLRASDATPSTADATAIYKDQLREVDAERERGLLPAAEAEAARTEIARRLLASDAEAAALPASSSLSQARLTHIALALAAGIPIIAMGFYLTFGEPNLPDQPLASRTKPAIAPDVAKVDDLIRAVELRLRQNPGDAQGWDVIAPVYMKQGRFQEAADAFAKAISMLGETTRRLAGFAESTVLANDGIVAEPARAAYEKLIKLEPTRIEPRFWLALAKEQDGTLDAALRDYETMLRDAPADANWRPMILERIETVRDKQGLPKLPPIAAPKSSPVPVASSTAPRGPTADDVAAADKMSAADRQQMIEGMVQGLADRLMKDARDLAGWQRLIRAYTTMGRKSDAVAALGTARQTFSAEPQSLSALKELAQSLGLES